MGAHSRDVRSRRMAFYCFWVRLKEMLLKEEGRTNIQLAKVDGKIKLVAN